MEKKTKIKMIVELQYDAETMHDNNTDKEAKEWFFKDILMKESFILHSNEIGDEIGDFKVLEILPPNNYKNIT